MCIKVGEKRSIYYIYTLVSFFLLLFFFIIRLFFGYRSSDARFYTQRYFREVLMGVVNKTVLNVPKYTSDLDGDVLCCLFFSHSLSPFLLPFLYDVCV